MRKTAIVPVFNEEDSLSDIVNRTINLVDEVVIVDDGSTDRSPVIAVKLAQVHRGKVKVVRLTKNRGKGYAIKVGLRVATGNVVVIQDADGEYPPEQLPNLIKPIESGKAGVCFGSRFLGSFTGMSVVHYVANKILSFLTSLVLFINVSDVMTGAKAWLKRIYENQNIESKGFAVEIELTIKLLRRTRCYTEIPFHYRRRRTGVAKIGPFDFVRSLIAILKFGLLRR